MQRKAGMISILLQILSETSRLKPIASLIRQTVLRLEHRIALEFASGKRAPLP